MMYGFKRIRSLLCETVVYKKQTVVLRNTNNSLPGYLGIMATRHVQFCCIFAVTKDKFDHF